MSEKVMTRAELADMVQTQIKDYLDRKSVV